MGNWSELHQDLLVEILKKIIFHEDYVTFGCICRSWLFAARNYNFSYKSYQIPWLMISEENFSNYKSFFSIWKDRIRDVYLPEARCKMCYSSKGWIITVDVDYSMSLLHPFSGVKIKLPNIITIMSRRGLCGYLIAKCALSSSPSVTSDSILVVIYGGRRELAYIRPGKKNWNRIDIRGFLSDYVDIVFYNDKFYAVNIRGEILVFDFSGEEVAGHAVAQLPSELDERNDDYREKNMLYLVECGGALLVVCRRAQYLVVENILHLSTFEFQIFEVDLRTNTWTVVKDLGNRALFLGSNVGEDNGVYNIHDGTTVPHFKGKFYSEFKDSPVWVEQSFDETDSFRHFY
ncbi:putative F-box protein At5g55150 [Mangifera indica]|uniref:putative F-box protein At5g55150 n=1 Tax=Mangifera indica TaxID=29780 RepID=UPI001CFAFE7A|nr:putative F-box protein At5g55150 [Mangifera indica]